MSKWVREFPLKQVDCDIKMTGRNGDVTNLELFEHVLCRFLYVICQISKRIQWIFKEAYRECIARKEASGGNSRVPLPQRHAGVPASGLLLRNAFPVRFLKEQSCGTLA